ncbi:MAG: serine/threonine protein kinase, partial [Myxococcales bacterium]
MTSAEEDVPSLPIGALLAGRHRLERLLGQGAMGSVYEASGPEGERVAVKVVRQPPGQAGSLRLARFDREARLASSLDSPHIVPVREVGADDEHEVAFAVMPLLEGEDAGALVRRLGPLPPVTAVRLVLQASEGLAVAHAAGVVHRDIKPSNLFLDRGPDGYTVRVADFGVAKSIADGLNLTAPGTSLGSPMYMAPEQLISAREVDARADVWALAMTLYELLAGAPAYHALASFQQIVLAQSTRPVPSLHEAAPWLDPGLVMVVHGALLRDLDARCPSVRALADALRPHAGGGLDLPFTLLQGITEERQRQLTAAPPRPAT